MIAGQGTIGMEILRQHQAPQIDAVFVAIGGGGLISGVANLHQGVRPRSRSSACRRTTPTRWLRSLAARQTRDAGRRGLFADGTAVKLVGEETFRLAAVWSTRS